ncbi:hypothetical protein SFUMM280S_01277 [Streptomyces fumanus]
MNRAWYPAGTVPSDTGTSSTAPLPTSPGRDSGSFTNTTTAQTSVIAASIRNPAR